MKNNNMIDVIATLLDGLIEEKLDSDYTCSIEKQAKEMGFAPTTFRKYTERKSEPSASNLKKIADYYGVSCDYLVGGTNYKAVNPKRRAVSEYTGLTDEAVNVLRGMVKDNEKGTGRLRALSHLLARGEFLQLLDGIDFCIGFAEYETNLERLVKGISEKTGRYVDEYTKGLVAQDRKTARDGTVAQIQTLSSTLAMEFIKESEGK